MSAPDYSAIIRVGRCDALLVSVVEALRAQTMPPSEILFVDSSRDPACAAALSALGRVVAYPEGPFNYARAVNVGVAAARGTYCLIISSHTLLRDRDMIALGWNEAQRHGAHVLYWSNYPEGTSGPPIHRVIDRRCFDGRNGLSNSCGMVPTALARTRPFREEVFAAEDHEWAKHYLRAGDHRVLGTIHAGLAYANPLHSGSVRNLTKYLNEEIAIAYYIRRRLLLPDRVAARLLRGALAGVRGRPDRVRLHLRIAWGLVKAWFREPKAESIDILAPVTGPAAAPVGLPLAS